MLENGLDFIASGLTHIASPVSKFDLKNPVLLYDFTNAQLIPPDMARCIAGKVNSAGRLYLVIESVRPDTKHLRDSNAPAHVDGAGGSLID